MYAIEAEDDTEKRKRLTPDIRNAIVRDLVSTMYAHMIQPNKDFCTKVAKQLVHKYAFMKDVGVNVTGYVSIYKHIHCLHTVATVIIRVNASLVHDFVRCYMYYCYVDVLRANQAGSCFRLVGPHQHHVCMFISKAPPVLYLSYNTVYMEARTI